MTPFRTKRRALLALSATTWAAGFARNAVAQTTGANALETIRASGVLKVAVYKDFYPYSDDGTGIDVELAGALADAMKLKLSLLPFDAGEEMSDDLRNMVWRGHYLGYGPADVMLHVPVDRVLMEKNEQVTIFAPYFRETIRIARNVQSIPDWSWDALNKFKMGVDGASIASQIMLAYEAGRYTSRVGIYKGIEPALYALRQGEVAAVMGTRAELSAGLHNDARFVTEDVVIPGVPRNGWTIGVAIKAGQPALQAAVQQAMDTLAANGELAHTFEKFGVAYSKP